MAASSPVGGSPSTMSQTRVTPIVRPHPLHNITEKEILQATSVIRKLIKETSAGSGAEIRFKSILLSEPPKALLLPYLNAEAAGASPSERVFVPRCLSLIWSLDNDVTVTESIVSLDANQEVSRSGTAKGQHGPIDRGENKLAMGAILSDPQVLAAIKKLHLPEDAIVQADTWMYGTDRDSDLDTHKFIQALLYARAPNNHPDSNQYAFPLPFSPVFDLFLGKVVRIDDLATGGKEDGLAYHTASENPMEHCVANEYHHDLHTTAPRSDLKPLRVVQPEGPSFKVSDGNCVEWQKWRFRVGFNYREGMTIHDVRYAGRPVFYRLSVSEMTVPYGDPRSPFHRKQAFDIGDCGAGSVANNLALGCDCLGSIYYFSGFLNDSTGAPLPAPNIICMHEQDAGIGWKHTNHRTGNASITRARVLVLQSIITVGNYEYIFAWHFMQNGNVELETRATGILSTHLIDADKTSHWGTVVSPGVLAPNHQHLFSLRIDPMLDGPMNSVLQEESIPVPQSEHENPHGNAWHVIRSPFKTAAAADANPLANRVFKMVNESVKNRISGNPVGYKLIPQPCQLILAGANSVARARARFAEHHLWVTRYRDGELWAGGKWTNQSLEEVDGVRDYAARGEGVRDADVVVWSTFGMTHNPRVEDFPVMPCEVYTIRLMPADFFEGNPALDVPRSVQEVNGSVLVEDPVVTGGVEVGEIGEECCGGKAKL